MNSGCKLKSSTLPKHKDMSSSGSGDFAGNIHSVRLVSLKSGEIENKRQKFKETVSAIHAMLNDKGGEVKLHFTNAQGISQLINVSKAKIKNDFEKIIEQHLVRTAGTQITSSNINFKEDINKKIIVEVKGANVMIMNNYNLFLPTKTQVVLVNPVEPVQRINDAILERKVVQNGIKLGSHCKRFIEKKDSLLCERKVVQVKNLKSTSSRRTTLADRMTGKGNRFRHYVSAFANYNGGHIYYGITDDGIVEGECIPNTDSIGDITKKVEKSINKMIWPEQIGQPKRGVHWEIFFEPVVDENSEAIPSTFVIVIYVAPCLGGVFAEEPECYKMVEGQVKKMSFIEWKRVLQPGGENRKEEIPATIQRITWSSTATERHCTKTGEFLMKLINNAQWQRFSDCAEYCENTFPDHVEIQLIVLSKRVITCCRQSYFGTAKRFLDKYNEILSANSKDTMIFEAIALYLTIALERAEGKLNMEIIAEALSKVEFIPQGIISASILVLAATSYTKGNNQQRNHVYQKVLCERALQHLQKVEKSNVIKTDLQRKAHINLAQQHLGCSLARNSVPKDFKEVDLDRAKSSIAAVAQSIAEEALLACYREIQFNNVQSILNYRYSQVYNDQSTHYLKKALDTCRKAKRGAEDCQFQEMIEWAKICEGLYIEELVRGHFRNTNTD